MPNAHAWPVMHVATCATAALLSPALAAQTPAHIVVPAAHATTDAISHIWLPGASRDARQQTLVGQGQLTALIGHTITALELRRNAANETYHGGAADLSLTLSIAPHSPLDCSEQFAANIGPTPTQVFAGSVALPTSPPQIGPTVAWSPDNTVRIQLQTPFLYLGGTLCIDLVGHPITGQNANWWMADAAFEDLEGTTHDLGGGCGNYGGADHDWSRVTSRSLLPGGYAEMSAYGTPNALTLTALGLPNPVGVPLSALGFPAGPGCDLHLASLDALFLSWFVPVIDPIVPVNFGETYLNLKLPGTTAAVGLSLTTQWIDLAQMATSNAIEWTIASSVPTLDMAFLEADPSESSAHVSVHCAHVWRFEYQ